ncbi:hypothetical protein MHH81_03725 [Psychrobacillus sp. FSL H8-0484]|uniref:hypothetical protein n=1 Tax=Psychrobacillus sp. FSL H8-0484 TaxID=2921390 RepID=UPI0030F4B968
MAGVHRRLEEIMGKDKIIGKGPLGGSEDFSHISQAVPSAVVVLGTGKEGEPPVHNPRMHRMKTSLNMVRLYM